MLLLLAMTASFYTPGLSGGWQFDDAINLSGLEQVDNLLSATVFSTSGKAGPLKRPVALASFALQAESWPNHPEHFLRVNLVIHLINGVLIWLLCLQLAHLLAPDANRRHAGFALAMAGAWLLAPFLASASLMTIQRMTTLSASFVFAGLLGYLIGRRMMARHPARGLWLALSSLGLGTLLAALTKENGALLPLLALITETLIIQRARQALPRLPRPWFMAALALPSLLLIGFLVYRGIFPSGYERRSFTLAERLLTQPRVLWDYLFNLLAPNARSVTPYTDGYVHSTGLLQPVSTLLALLGLVVLGLGAFFCRQRWPALAFGILFFLAGHLVESTTIALELYFAHRNYVPALGLFFTLGWLLFFSPPLQRVPLLAPLIAAIFVAFSAATLAWATFIWGQPDQAAQRWYDHQPHSIRAAQALAAAYARNNALHAADDILQQTLEKRPDHPMLPMLLLQRLELCATSPEESLGLIEQAQQALAPPAEITFATAITLNRLALNLPQSGCAALQDIQLALLIEAALVPTRRWQGRKAGEYLYYAKAQVAQTQGDFEEMRRRLEQAHQLVPQDPQTPSLIAYSWVLQNDLPAARAYLRASLTEPPQMNALQLRAWRRELEDYLARLTD